MKKRLLSIVIAGVMAASLVACSGGNTAETSAQSQASAESKSADSSEASKDTP